MDQAATERRRRRFLNVALTTHEGKTVRFYDDLVKDKTVMLNFFYTNCVNEAICPLSTANLVRVQKLLASRMGRDVFMYSITLDPAHDTPKVLAKYARAFGVGPGWLFLTGDAADLEALRRNLGYVSPDPVEEGPVPAHRDAAHGDRAARALGRLRQPGAARMDRPVTRAAGAP